MTRLLASIACVSFAIFPHLFAQSAFDDAEASLDERVHAFSQQVRCLVCQNETLAESRAELAVDLRREIRQQMKDGRSDAQITAFLTERYGDFVLYRPPLKPATYLLWFGPFAVLGSALSALYRWVTRWPKRPDLRPPSQAQRERARRLLEVRDGEETA